MSSEKLELEALVQREFFKLGVKFVLLSGPCGKEYDDMLDRAKYRMTSPLLTYFPRTSGIGKINRKYGFPLESPPPRTDLDKKLTPGFIFHAWVEASKSGTWIAQKELLKVLTVYIDTSFLEVPESDLQTSKSSVGKYMDFCTCLRVKDGTDLIGLIPAMQAVPYSITAQPNPARKEILTTFFQSLTSPINTSVVRIMDDYAAGPDPENVKKVEAYLDKIDIRGEEFHSRFSLTYKIRDEIQNLLYPNRKPQTLPSPSPNRPS